ncbi:GatB/YqeY domain containing protein [Bombilactobacillus mellifer]|uniref:GatB/YqeY domain containing protein n=1 Tax=Bombilactobacillus mellifer TaxID=1218492 RepID=A0A0F4LTQ2_9LACO|nr:GatB/YqeY domain-containing protein [Bombilactobacillus mellifer]MBH9990780.1 GatB/YqeY domain-containing protein [Lactobacillus sp. W8092]KJY61743.1 GatB/YqeY domain containing protein [Bombilactobacillus mellifer]MCT6825765.1 GatB/YqeY domain-containing protein [Bombilactobacillus mellifer]MCT6843188.1 GatB/YqeY domain-containing protein [Bombilactobacillus mellifer]MCT6894486.1 GatB/YqeY domain-containing protein [Bombilactobacillus mellifer]
MSLTDQLMTDIKTAMKSQDKTALSVIRMLKSALMNKKIELGHVLTDQEEAQVVASQMKQQKDSLADFQKGGRDDLVAQTQAQMKVLQQYLPQQLSKAELQQIVQQSAAEIQATSAADFGKLMKTVMPKVRGRADGSLVNQIVKAFLQ